MFLRLSTKPQSSPKALDGEVPILVLAVGKICLLFVVYICEYDDVIDGEYYLYQWIATGSICMNKKCWRVCCGEESA